MDTKPKPHTDPIAAAFELLEDLGAELVEGCSIDCEICCSSFATAA